MSKYHAKPCVEDNIKFASHHEKEVYLMLAAAMRAGAIWGLQLQVRFPLVVNGVKVCVYVADFVYEDAQGSHVVDAKGVLTPVYKLKKKLMAALYNITIEEV